MATQIIAVGRIVDGITHWRIAPPVVSEADIDALLDGAIGAPVTKEVYGKAQPNEIDYDAELEDLIEARLDEEDWRLGQW